MKRSIRGAITFITVLTLGSGIASAQPRIPAAPIAAALSEANIAPDQATVQHQGRRKGMWIGTGIAIGAGVGAAGAYWAANSYGQNEGGRFCTRCFVTWGAVSIPAGAVVGALVGNLLSRSTAPQRALRVPRTFVTPVIGRRGGAVVLSVRY